MVLFFLLGTPIRFTYPSSFSFEVKLPTDRFARKISCRKLWNIRKWKVRGLSWNMYVHMHEDEKLMSKRNQKPEKLFPMFVWIFVRIFITRQLLLGNGLSWWMQCWLCIKLYENKKSSFYPWHHLALLIFYQIHIILCLIDWDNLIFLSPFSRYNLTTIYPSLNVPLFIIWIFISWMYSIPLYICAPPKQ